MNIELLKNEHIRIKLNTLHNGLQLIIIIVTPQRTDAENTIMKKTNQSLITEKNIKGMFMYDSSLYIHLMAHNT